MTLSYPVTRLFMLNRVELANELAKIDATHAQRDRQLKRIARKTALARKRMLRPSKCVTVQQVTA